MQQDFVGKVALVTAASRGIGWGAARELASRGAAVAITARDKDALYETAGRIAAETGVGRDRILAIPGDAGDPDARAGAVRETVETFGRLDVLVNNAGISTVAGPLIDADLAEARRMFDVNVLAALDFVQLASKAWMLENGGAVVNVGSTAGLAVTGIFGIYGATKLALSKLTEELAYQLGPRIRINAVAPAVVKTKFAEPLYLGQEEKVIERYPLRRLGLPQDVAKLIAFLASDDASWITGETVRIDGGQLVHSVIA
ncbi:SDR family oxidoreductase [Nonomuraea lactucae]|uniref:SDR family oxidoreductase n=1 Tax=Nonomuraea lactucae TaxID=2249762 RepID=UPI000DE306B7|nr:SDR family oxidoreductase [Nonomuraea lactucae]